MACYNHPERESTGKCMAAGCEKEMCDDCTELRDSKRYCRECAARLGAETAPAPPTPGPPGAAPPQPQPPVVPFPPRPVAFVPPTVPAPPAPPAAGMPAPPPPPPPRGVPVPPPVSPVPGPIGVPAKPAVHPLSIVSVVCGGLSLVAQCCVGFLGVLPAGAAVVCGILGWRTVPKSAGFETNKILCLIGLISGGLGLLVSIAQIVLVGAMFAGMPWLQQPPTGP